MFETGSVFILIRKYVTNNSLRKKNVYYQMKKKIYQVNWKELIITFYMERTIFLITYI